MEEKNITMADMIVRIIQENQLAAGEEDLIWEMLGERKQGRHEKRGCGCLAEYVEKEMDTVVARQERDIRKKYRCFNKKFFRESRIGSMDIGRVSAADIRKLIVLTAGTQGMGSEDRLFFLFMLQFTLNALAREGRLSFAPSPKIYGDCKEAEGRITFIENPYTAEDVRKITGWVDASPHDMWGLAVGLWLESDITPEEIVGLKKECLMDADGACTENPTVLKKNGAEDYIALAGRRGRIIQGALRLHGDRDLEYIFMSEGKDGWKKMLGRCLPLKMSYICRDIGIAYKPFKCTDAIKWPAG